MEKGAFNQTVDDRRGLRRLGWRRPRQRHRALMQRSRLPRQVAAARLRMRPRTAAEPRRTAIRHASARCGTRAPDLR
ncbi:MAG: hypothetical protein MZW92_64440 [Comamonadaceae bacterium]|nr:hypothetical protein [Comamonadaceae bacterium]